MLLPKVIVSPPKVPTFVSGSVPAAAVRASPWAALGDQVARLILTKELRGVIDIQRHAKARPFGQFKRGKRQARNPIP